LILQRQKRNIAVLELTLVIAIGEPSWNFSQVHPPERLAALRTERWWGRYPAVHQDEFHMPPPNEKQNTVLDGLRLLGGGAQR